MDTGSTYKILVAPTCFHDSAGNNFSGIADSLPWTFTVVDSSSPVVNSIVSNTPTGVYGIGDSISITINFSQPVTLSPDGT
ncbi:MAG: hypothetical protein QNK40_10860, partial [Desulfobacterales bacterium]|nr:hypothetical protein [Desulfobacterales bacterium]